MLLPSGLPFLSHWDILMGFRWLTNDKLYGKFYEDPGREGQAKMNNGKQAVIKRLKTTRGHLRRVIKMVEEGKYCIDILQQSLAVQNALKRIDEEVLAAHLSSCVRRALSDEEKDKQLKEILEVFKKGRG